MLRAPARIAFIDDDPMVLETMVLALPQRFSATFHLHPASLNALLGTSRAQLQQEQAALVGIAQAQVDAHHNAVEKALLYFAEPSRFETVGVLVSDYAMPAEDGVSLCKRHGTKGLQRVLLTGVADNEKAIEAFNAGAIDAYFPKHSPNIRERLIAALDAQIRQSAASRGAVLEQALPAAVLDQLRLSHVETALSDLLSKHDIVEYLFLGAPLGLIGVTSAGQVIWVQIEDEESLASLIEGLRAAGHSEAEIQRVADKQELVNLDIMARLDCHASTAKTHTLVASPFLGAAVFALDHIPPDLKPASHTKWMSERQYRVVT